MLDFKNQAPGLQTQLELVEHDIDEILRLDAETGALGAILANVRGARGKMLRPTLLLLAGYNGPAAAANQEQLCRLGAMVEIIHMASLVHDDIVDDSPLRRGRITVQAQFGKDMAVYTGDLLLARVTQQLFLDKKPEAGLLLTHVMEEMCRGEIGQYACRWDTETTLDAYLQNIHGKTVALFMAACKLGALTGGLPDPQLNALTTLGMHLGYMFQLRDDLLDYLSSQQREGKPVQQDFRDGIYTMPLLYALSQTEYGARLRELAQQSRAAGYTEAQLQELQKLVRLAGGIEFTWEQIQNHAIQAERQLALLPAGEATQLMRRLVQWLKNRKAFQSILLPKSVSAS